MSNLIDRQTAIANINKAIPEWSEDKEIAIDCLKNTPSLTQMDKELNPTYMDCISRQAAIDCVTTGAKPTTIRGRIAELPSAQPEIIRCKDCKHGMYDVMCKFYWCHGVAHSANWFCADGERREDE